MATKAQATPKGRHTVTPSLVIAGAAKAIDFYKKALATVCEVKRAEDSTAGCGGPSRSGSSTAVAGRPWRRP